MKIHKSADPQFSGGHFKMQKGCYFHCPRRTRHTDDE